MVTLYAVHVAAVVKLSEYEVTDVLYCSIVVVSAVGALLSGDDFVIYLSYAGP